VAEQRWIKEIDMNPLFASADDLVALDARVILHDPKMKDEDLPKLAIRPYPMRYVREWKMKDGTPLTLRPIRPEDEPMLVKFHETLSERSVYFRYFSPLKLTQRVAHERLLRMCFNDYDREMAIVAEHRDAKTGETQVVGVSRLSKDHGFNEAEFALIVTDQWQNRGIGSELLKMLVEIGRDEKVGRIWAHILPDNHDMIHVCKKVGFAIHHDKENKECQAEIRP